MYVELYSDHLYDLDEEGKILSSEGYERTDEDQREWVDTLDELEFSYSVDDKEFYYKDFRGRTYRLTREENEKFKRGRFYRE